MRLNYATEQEIDILKRLTSTDCSVTPSLLGFKINAQDSSVLSSKDSPKFARCWGKNVQWFMPGGYIAYILMTKLPGEPLDLNVFWNEDVYTKADRDEVRKAFKESYM